MGCCQTAHAGCGRKLLASHTCAALPTHAPPHTTARTLVGPLQAQGAAGKRMAGAKRKVQQLEKGAGEQLAEAGRTLSKLNAGSKKDKLTDFLTKVGAIGL